MTYIPQISDASVKGREVAFRVRDVVNDYSNLWRSGLLC